MSDYAEVIFDLRRRVQALEFRQMQRELDDIVRRIEVLEAAKRVGEPSGSVASDLR